MARYAHLTQGKAGSQWVTDVLSDPRIIAFVLGLRFERAAGIEYRLSNWSAAAQPVFAGPIFSVPHQEWLHYGSSGDKAVFVHRDPRDGAVSWMFSLALSHVTEPHVSLMRPALLSLDLRHRLMLAIYLSWESAWIVRSWAGIRVTESEFVTTYERIVADEVGQFRAIVDFFGWPVPDDILQEVVRELSFVKRSGGRERGKLDVYSHYRRGAPGDWHNYFDRRLGELFENAMPGLLVALGYEQSNDWYEDLPEFIEALGDSEGDPDSVSDLAILNRLDDLAKKLYAVSNKDEQLASRHRHRTI